MINIKNVLIAALFAYLVLDLSCAFVLKRKRPLLFQHLYSVARKERKLMWLCFLLAIGAGAGMYYVSTNMLQ